MAYNSESNEVGVYKLSGLGQGGSTGDEPVVEFGDSTTKLFVSKKSVIQVPEASVVAAAGDGTPMVSILAVPAAKKGDKQKTTTVNIDVILNPVGSVVTSAIQVAFDLNLAMTTAKVGTDYLGPVSGVVDFQPGQTIQTIAVKFVTAKLTEAEQAVVYQITSVTNAVLGSNSSTTIDCIDANLGEAEMAHLILAQQRAKNTLIHFEDILDKGKGLTPAQTHTVTNVFTIIKGLNTVAADYAAIYTGDPTFDAAYLVYRTQQTIITWFQPKFPQEGQT